MLFYAAAGLRQEVADEFDALAADACGERIVWVTGLGSTESAPFALCTGAQ
jgi:feruloyl-CoA synthase